MKKIIKWILSSVLGVILLLLILILVVGLVEYSKEISKKREIVQSNEGVSYDSKLTHAFNNRLYTEFLLLNKDFIGLEINEGKIWARVGVVPKDYSGIKIEGNKSEKRDLVNKRVEWFEQETEEVLKDYLEKEGFTLSGKTSAGFGALVTKEVFEKLIEDSRIEEVTWVKTKIEGAGYEI